MRNIVPVGTKGRKDVKVWLDEVSREESLIYVAIAINAMDNEAARQVAEEIKNQEMLVLRKQGHEMLEGFKPEVTEQQIDGVASQVTTYRFIESAWKRKIMGRDKKKA